MARRKPSKKAAKPKQANKPKRAKAPVAEPDEADDLDDLPDLEPLPDAEDELPELAPMDDEDDLGLDLEDAAIAAAADLVPDAALQTLPADDPLSTLPVADVSIEEPDEIEELPDLEEIEELPEESDTVMDLPVQHDTLLEIGAPAAAAAPAPEPAGEPEKQLPSDAPEELAVMPDAPAETDDRMVRTRGSQAMVAKRMLVLEEQIGGGLLEREDQFEMPPGAADLVERGHRLRGPHSEGAARAAKAQSAAEAAATALTEARAKHAAATTARDAAVTQATGTGEMLADHLLGNHVGQIARLAGKKLPAGLGDAIQLVARISAIDDELAELEGKPKKAKKLRGDQDAARKKARSILVGLGTSSFPLVDALAKGCAACASSRTTLAGAAEKVEATEAELRAIDLATLQAAATNAARDAERAVATEAENDAAWHEIAPRVGKAWLAHRAELGSAPESEEERLWRELHGRYTQLETYCDALVLHLKAAQAEAAAQQTERLEAAVNAATKALEGLHQLRDQAAAEHATVLEGFEARRTDLAGHAQGAAAAVEAAVAKARTDGEAAAKATLEQFEAARKQADQAHRTAISDTEAAGRAAAERVTSLRQEIETKAADLTSLLEQLNATDTRIGEVQKRLDGLQERVPAAEALDTRTREAAAKVDELATKVEWASNETNEAAKQVAEMGAAVGDLAGRVSGPIEEARAALTEKLAAFDRDIDVSREALATSEQKTRKKRADETSALVESVKKRAEKAVAEFESHLKQQAGGARGAAGAGGGRRRPEPDLELEPIDDDVELEPLEDEPPRRRGDRGSSREPRAEGRGKDRGGSGRGRRRR